MEPKSGQLPGTHKEGSAPGKERLVQGDMWFLHRVSNHRDEGHSRKLQTLYLVFLICARPYDFNLLRAGEVFFVFLIFMFGMFWLFFSTKQTYGMCSGAEIEPVLWGFANHLGRW